VDKYGFQQPAAVGMISGAVGGLLAVDNMLKVTFFTTLWDNFNPNYFAAIPSLHGAYPLAIAFFIWKKFRGRTYWWFIYPVLTWFAAVYLNQHYIVDLIIGAGYLAAAYLLTDRVLLPRVFDRFVDYEKTIRALGRGRRTPAASIREER
jgi:membrane-associated phospholipid phosphatase